MTGLSLPWAFRVDPHGVGAFPTAGRWLCWERGWREGNVCMVTAWFGGSPG